MGLEESRRDDIIIVNIWNEDLNPEGGDIMFLSV
jgi:hypothetical protein